MIISGKNHSHLKPIDENGRKISGIIQFNTTTGIALMRVCRVYPNGDHEYLTRETAFPAITFIDKRSGAVFLRFVSPRFDDKMDKWKLFG